MSLFNHSNHHHHNLFTFIFSNPLGSTSNAPLIIEQEQEQEEELSNKINSNDLRAAALAVAHNLASLHRLSPPTPDPASPQDDLLSPILMLCLPNSIAFAYVLLGALAAGITATLVNPALTPPELATLISAARPALLISPATARFNIERAIRLAGLPPGSLPPDLILVHPADSPAWSRLLLHPPSLPPPCHFPPAQARRRIALVLWTSGTTTGKPKPIKLSHHALIASLSALIKIHPQYSRSHQRFAGFAPFFHIFGLTNVLLTAILLRATIFVQPKFNLNRFLALISVKRLTQLHISPPIAAMLSQLEKPESYNFTSVQSAVSGGAPLLGDLIQQVLCKTGIWIKMGYGLSEMSGVTHQMGEQVDHDRLGCAGLPLQGVQVKIEAGEIMVQSESMMNGYLGEEPLELGCWFKTGDLGHFDHGGQLWITGRVKDLIKVKGYQVSPIELESHLGHLNLFAESVVVSIYDAEQATEFPRAYIVPLDPTLQAVCRSTVLLTASSHHHDDQPLLAETRGRFSNLAMLAKQAIEGNFVGYKWLRGNIVFIDKIPKSPSGKILRRSLLTNQTHGVFVKIYDDRHHHRNHSKKRSSRL